MSLSQWIDVEHQWSALEQQWQPVNYKTMPGATSGSYNFSGMAATTTIFGRWRAFKKRSDGWKKKYLRPEEE